MSGRSLVVLVTGSNSGFGRAMSESLARDGHQVYGTTRSRVVLSRQPCRTKLRSANVPHRLNLRWITAHRFAGLAVRMYSLAVN